MSSTLPSPRLVALLLCNTVIEDIRTRNKSFIGCFNAITVSKVPFRMPLLSLVVALTECRGEQEVLVTICCDDGNEKVEKPFELNATLQSDNPLGVVELIFELHGFPINKIGKYTIRVTSKDKSQTIGYRDFQVINSSKTGEKK